MLISNNVGQASIYLEDLKLVASVAELFRP